jgi:hypothetical protein
MHTGEALAKAQASKKATVCRAQNVVHCTAVLRQGDRVQLRVGARARRGLALHTGDDTAPRRR